MLPNAPFLVFAVLASLFNPGSCQKCRGQSCAIAALSGSTNESFEDIVKSSGSGKQPQGSNSKGKQCITKYYKQLGLKAPVGLSRSVHPESIEFTSEAFRRGTVDIEKRQSCKQNIHLFARGTTEPGTMGSTVGPALSSALTRQGGGKWKTEGVKYSADVAGDDCIGLPGGIKCRDQLAKIAASCPTSNFFISGYSEGAMVAHICTAFSADPVKKRIKGVVVFGDPFNGASIKGFPQENIKTLCNASDGVCGGKFQITPGHLSYTAGGTISEAARWMIQKAGS